MPAPTIGTNTNNSGVQTQGNPGGGAAAAAPIIPFTRASRQKSRLGGQVVQAITAQQTALPPFQVPAAGYLRKIRISVAAVTAGNSAAVAFQPDAPYNVLQQISFLAANGDSLINPIDGFALAMVNKYGCMANQMPGADPRSDPAFNLTTGAGATGGTFQFNFEIPLEMDTRDGFGSLANMAANQSFLLQMSLNSAANIYTTPPTTLPSVTITYVLEYWSNPNSANASGIAQQTAPTGNGSVHLIQVAQPPIVPGTDQNIQLPQVGNTIRAVVLILRNAAGVRTETDWPAVTQWFVNNDPWFYKTKGNWRHEIGQRYVLSGPAATPTVGAQDNGVYILSDFLASGAGGDELAQATGNRNLFLVTNSATAFNMEAQNWGAGASSLQVITLSVRPSDPAALYQPFTV